MLRLIKAEMYILFKSRAIKVLCVVALLLGLSSVGMAKLMTSEDFLRSSMNGMSAEQQDQFIQSLSTPDDKNGKIVQPSGSIGVRMNAKDILHPTAKDIFYNSFGSGVAEILLTILIAGMVAREYSSGTIKNILAYGKKRQYYYISKLVACTVGFAILLAIMVTTSTVFSSLIFGWGEPFTFTQLIHIVEVFAGAIVVGMGIVSVLMLLATSVKSNGTTIGIGIVVMAVLPAVISFLYGRYTWYDKIYESTLYYNWALVTSARAANCDILRATIVGVITVLIAAISGIAIFKRQDIK